MEVWSSHLEVWLERDEGDQESSRRHDIRRSILSGRTKKRVKEFNSFDRKWTRQTIRPFNSIFPARFVLSCFVVLIVTLSINCEDRETAGKKGS